MNIQIITSSYPASFNDPTGAAGLFVQAFASELSRQGHRVIVQPVARQKIYQPDADIIIEPIPWIGGDQELASMKIRNPKNWHIFLHFILKGRKKTMEIHKKYKIDRSLCMWIVPSGIFGFWIKNKLGGPYDVWALGSDVWKIRRVPLFGCWLLRKVIREADRVFADGINLCKDVESIAGVRCEFLPSCRTLPLPLENLLPLEPKNVLHLLFVGRYHYNKGPDLLLESISCLPESIKKTIHLHMFGTGPLKGKLEKMITEMGLQEYISFNGPIQAQDFANYLKRVEFLIIPSRIESIPVVFSDAVQTGTPVIATPAGDLKELINRFQCGLVAQDIIPKALAAAIEEAVKSGKRAFSEGAHKSFRNFEISNTVKRWVNCSANL
jgi:glycosyltransferase involved in cell wall biosynthesis